MKPYLRSTRGRYTVQREVTWGEWISNRAAAVRAWLCSSRERKPGNARRKRHTTRCLGGDLFGGRF